MQSPVTGSKYRQTGGTVQYRWMGAGQKRFKNGRPFIQIPPCSLQMQYQQLLQPLPVHKIPDYFRRYPDLHHTHNKCPEVRSPGYRNMMRRVAEVSVSCRHPLRAALTVDFPRVACLAELHSRLLVEVGRRSQITHRTLPDVRKMSFHPK